MCGFLGIVNNCEINFKEFNSALKKISHRGPDKSSIWSSEDKKINFGHNRLSIIDLSNNASQPMVDDDNNLVIIFNGEIYNFNEIKSSLPKNYIFKTNSDTEVLLKAYHYWGDSFVKKLNGMFAFAIYDLKKKRIFAARDRVGQKPFFYYFKDDKFIFGSEIKSIIPLIKHDDHSVDIKSLNCLFEFGYVPSDNCIINNFKKLPPAHCLTFDLIDKKIEINKYWHIKDINKKENIMSSKNLLTDFIKVFDRSVKRHLTSDVPVGVLLSGGIDSSLVTAFASRHINNLKTFTVSFPNQKEFNESKYAKIVSNHFSTDHYELEIDDDLDPAVLLPRLAEQYDEPIFDSSMLPTYLICKEINKYCKVVLGGDGADELFGGYHYHQRILITQFIKKFAPQQIWNILSNISRIIPVGYRGKFWLESLKYDLKNDLPNVATFFNSLDRQKIFDKASYTPDSSFIRKNNFHKSSNLVDRTLWTDFLNYLPEDILVKTDRASMINSLELRAPFLDNEVIDFVQILPSNFKVNKSNKKIFLKELSKLVLPANLNLNRKQGFSIPINMWIRKNSIWKNYFENILFDTDYIFLNKNQIFKLYNNHIKGLNLGEKLFGIVMFILWQKKYLDS